MKLDKSPAHSCLNPDYINVVYSPSDSVCFCLCIIIAVTFFTLCKFYKQQVYNEVLKDLSLVIRPQRCRGMEAVRGVTPPLYHLTFRTHLSETA